MKKLLMVLLMIPMMAHAVVEVNTRGLTESQKAELVKQAELMKQEAAGPVDDPADRVDKWVNVGERVGKMLGGAAKEVGVAVNQFVTTPVGMMTAALIVWHYMGSMIIHVISGWVVLIISVMMITYVYRRSTKQVITYDVEAGRNWLGNYPIQSITRPAMEDGEQAGFLVAYFLAASASVLIMFSW